MEPNLFRFNALLFPNFNYSKCFCYLLGQNRIHELLNVTLLIKNMALLDCKLSSLKIIINHATDLK
ncbi:hypothetical protein ALO63_200014 [Pseudomonas amygdali pv. mori]|uniref:Hemin ABC transporter permease n=1 Tax=Pseudomonas amygdali pv. mori TaxID=34065 RepID=A0A0P9V8F3_PSEA0|nr:hypothetical protein ALO63_200014 [Pseudomonas amygdali pv. mori]